MSRRNSDAQSLQNVPITEVDNGNSGAAATIDFSEGLFQKVTLTDNAALTFTPPTANTRVHLVLIQDGTGSRIPTFPASVKWAGGEAPTLSTDANAIDIATFFYDGTDYYGVASLGFA